MNIFVIPSWYPSEIRPISGVFVREQVEAVAALCPKIRVIVSTWGFDDGAVPFSQPIQAVSAMRWRCRQKSGGVSQRNGVWEIFHPLLTFSEKLPFGAKRLLEANRLNFAGAESKFGKIDVIHAHVSYPAGHIARLLAKENNIPYIITEHMGPFPFPSMLERDGRLRAEIRSALSDSAKIIAVSRTLAADIEAFEYDSPLVIPNSVDGQIFFPGSVEGNRFVFFTLCNICDGKGVSDLIQAIARWRPSPESVEFRIGGEGAMRKEYEQLAKNLGVSELIRWLGAVDRNSAPALFRDCHVFVLPSKHETFGVVYAEAIATGKPVIATRCGGPESIVNRDNGRLINVGNVEELARVMEWMKAHWEEFSADKIRHDFEGRFSREAVVHRLIDVYQSVLQG